MEPRVIVPRALKYLLAIAEHGNYTRAAEALHVSQPALSQQILHLEELLQSILLDRSGRRIRLTSAGEKYLCHAQRACGELAAGAEALRALEQLDSGMLRIGWTPITDFLTCRFLAEFEARYPGIDVQSLVMPQDDIQHAVADNAVDFGVVYGEPWHSDTVRDDIDRQVLFVEPLCLAVGHSHPRFGQSNELGLGEFGRESMVVLNPSFALRRIIDGYCSDNAVNPRIAVETDSLTVVLEMVRQGLLASVLPQSIVQNQHGLFPIRLSVEMPRHEVTMICRKGGYKSPASRAFRSLVLDSAGSGFHRTA